MAGLALCLKLQGFLLELPVSLRSPGNAGGGQAWLVRNTMRMSYDRKKSTASRTSDSHHSYQNHTFSSQFSSSSYHCSSLAIKLHKPPPCPNPSSSQSIDSSQDPSISQIQDSRTPLKSEIEQRRANRVFTPVLHSAYIYLSP